MTMMEKPDRITHAVPMDDTVPTYNARDLIDQGVQARIVLDHQTYTLRITRAGKLILTK